MEVSELLFARALRNLEANDRVKWGANYRVYSFWASPKRLRYIEYIQEEATLGLPMAQELMAEVVRLRMTS